ncbi:membrane protein [Lysobacter arseniciresistens ZS79]|uniref:undecaprenyl-diphosphate phosphatase n=1 Tax=Lysobacter arseniciresistens ZS79 TaxID=913325 RepID=A0A0A0F552_9GAMM|nr:membrane protein [Lysobacter arseniciresistens ZS79]
MERGLLREVWQRHGGRLLLVFVGLLLPMWGFAELADEIRESEPLAFDEPLLLWARSLAGPGMDRWLVAVTDAGYLYGVVPADVLLVVALLLWRRLPEATFAAIALAGSALLNVGTKLLFARERPSLWESIAPEVTYSFPSGHAMGSATLAWVLVLLAWRTRWRWPVLLLVAPFVVLVGFSRVYLGVHYPSDILAGWAAASVWAAASYFAVFRFRSVPWHR